jgi:hypothetical protein
MAIRRNVIFKSNAFNTTEQRESFVNEDCFGDDLARWLIEELRARGYEVLEEPGAEDFGWYLKFVAGGKRYCFVISFCPAYGETEGRWMCTMELAGFLGVMKGALIGGRNRGISTEAVQAVHSILISSPEIRELRWFSDADYKVEQNGQTEPISP